MNETRRALEAAFDALPRGLREHVLRVVEEAQRRAQRHGLDTERPRLAALAHDLARKHTPAESSNPSLPDDIVRLLTCYDPSILIGFATRRSLRSAG